MNTYIQLTSTDRTPSRKTGLRLVIIGTVALTAAVIASLCLYKNTSATKAMVFYGEIANSEKQVAFM